MQSASGYSTTTWFISASNSDSLATIFSQDSGCSQTRSTNQLGTCYHNDSEFSLLLACCMHGAGRHVFEDAGVDHDLVHLSLELRQIGYKALQPGCIKFTRGWPVLHTGVSKSDYGFMTQLTSAVLTLQAAAKDALRSGFRALDTGVCTQLLCLEVGQISCPQLVTAYVAALA